MAYALDVRGLARPAWPRPGTYLHGLRLGLAAAAWEVRPLTCMAYAWDVPAWPTPGPRRGRLRPGLGSRAQVSQANVSRVGSSPQLRGRADDALHHGEEHAIAAASAARIYQRPEAAAAARICQHEVGSPRLVGPPGLHTAARVCQRAGTLQLRPLDLRNAAARLRRLASEVRKARMSKQRAKNRREKRWRSTRRNQEEEDDGETVP